MLPIVGGLALCLRGSTEERGQIIFDMASLINYLYVIGLCKVLLQNYSKHPHIRTHGLRTSGWNLANKAPLL